MTFKARFAQNLARARKKAGLTQEEVAARASLGRDTVWKHEAQVHVPILDVLVRLAGAVSVQPAELLDGITYRPSFIGMGEGRYEIVRSDFSSGTDCGAPNAESIEDH